MNNLNIEALRQKVEALKVENYHLKRYQKNVLCNNHQEMK